LSADGGFVYTPEQGFRGTDTFSYQATDGERTSRPEVVTIRVGDPEMVKFIFQTVDESGNIVDAVSTGAKFWLQVWVQDVSEPPREGVFSAFLDISFDAEMLQVVGLLYGSD